ncbi:MAG: PQQ-dependent sugar dehydrogenase [Euryarchaeota archaeon]|nr:PQQ-dependent sugar dehydrogenase [Euryarchaeota archaeon]
MIATSRSIATKKADRSIRRRALLSLIVVAALLLVVVDGMGQPRTPAEEAGNGGQGDRPQDGAGDERQGPAAEMTEWQGLMLPPGVEGEVIADGLMFPTGIDWDTNGTLYVSLVGFAPDNRQILRQTDDDSFEPLDLSGANITEQILDLTYHEGSIYFSSTGRIHVHDLGTNETRTIMEGLPAWGDHRTDEIVFGEDGRLYVGQGTVTNSGLVGFDNLGQPNAINNVSGERPEYRDIPCEDIRLSGWNWETAHPFNVATDLNADQGAGQDAETVHYETEEEARQAIEDDRRGGNRTQQDRPGNQSAAQENETARRDGLWLTWRETGAERAVTGPFSPFATPTYQGQTIEGEAKCNGSVLSMEPDGSDLRPVAWGFRNPFALKFDDEGRLWVSDNGPDKRGSRPLGPGPDTIQRFEVDSGNDTLPWYGWPDHTVGYAYTHPFFAPPWGPDVEPVFDEPPSEPITQFTWTGSHASSNKFDFGLNGTTYENSLFIAEFGSLGIQVKVDALSGMDVARVDLETGRVTEFITGVDRWNGDFRPVEAVFGPDDRLYVVTFGPAKLTPEEGNTTRGAAYTEEFQPGEGRILAFTLPDQMDWDGLPVGNPGGQGQFPSGGETGTRPDNATVVNVFDYGFSEAGPVGVGTPVTFANIGRVGHTATEDGNLFNSGFELAPRTNFTWTPQETGTYSYYCAVHPSMRGSIEVQEEATAEEEEEDDGEAVPGFGVALGLVALGGMAVVMRGRRGI